MSCTHAINRCTRETAQTALIDESPLSGKFIETLSAKCCTNAETLLLFDYDYTI